ncbi:MAG TPA: type II secretion system F family protein [Nocardioidaceae bacterium]|jgi:Flp pilus assembly protein TadB
MAPSNEPRNEPGKGEVDVVIETTMAAGAAAAAVWVATPREAAGRIHHMLGAGHRDHGANRRDSRRSLDDQRVRALVCVLACSALACVFVGGVGALAAVPAGLTLSWWLGRVEPRRVARDRAAFRRDLPLAIELLAACADAGLPLEQALGPVAGAVRGPLGDRLLLLSARLALGASPIDEWGRMGADPELAGLGNAVIRAHRSGAPVAATLGRLAGDSRRTRRSRQQAAARAVGVKVAAPLAACFLPAFMLIGVVPTVVTGFAQLGL